MTIDEELEKAIYDLLITEFTGFEETVSIIPFVAETDQDDAPISYPAVQFACAPFMPTNPGGVLGSVTVSIMARTHGQDDTGARMLQKIYEKAISVMTAGTIGPRILDPWLVCGVDDTLEGGITVNPEDKTQDKGRAYRIAVADTT